MDTNNSANMAKSEFPWKIINWIAAAVVFLFTFIIYARTTQVSVSFWDCGEFIATSYILGVPHPPGAPLFILIGRVISMIPLPFTPTFLINLYSSLTNALSILMIYLIISYSLSKWFIKVSNTVQAMIVLAGAISGALIAAFSNTYWNNAIEAEVYGVSMFLVSLVVYLALRWADNHKDPASDKYLIFIPFLLYLGVGVHMTTLIMLPPVFLFIIFISEEKRKSILFWFTWAVLFSVATAFKLFLITMVLGLLVALVGALLTAGKSARNWRLAFITLLVCGIGFTTYGIIPIRSFHNPMIDENDPETLHAFQDYMDRKQYGQESMWSSMFKRKADWQHQFGFCFHEGGVHKTQSGKTIYAESMLERMGFWRQFSTQYTRNRKASLNGLIPFILILIGLWGQYKQDRRRWVLLFLVLLVSTLGLLFYMNFSDGLHGTRLEVRIRDYFYTPGFMFMGMWIGIGFATILSFIYNLKKKLDAAEIISGALAVVCTFTFLIPLTQYYFEHDRSRNWIPEDYAYNILQSCEKNAIIFTNGDNDTFPVWFIQAVNSVRTDVRVANLSLLNTNWYIKQLKNQMGIDISFSDAKIDKLKPYRTENGIVRVQDIMVKHIINNADVVETPDGELKIDPPIYFAVTVSPSNKLNYEPFLSMEGLVYKLTTDKGKRQVGKEMMKENLFKVYKFRGLADTTIYKDDNSKKLLQNYTTAFMTLALQQKQDGELAEAIETMEYAQDVLGYDWRSYVYLANLYSEAGEVDKLDEIYTETMANDKYNADVYRVFSDIFIRAGMQDRGLNLLETGYKMMPNNENLFKTLAYYYNKYGKNTEMEALVQDWMARHPDDEELKKYFQRRAAPQPQTETHTLPMAPVTEDDE
ncbi:DUF2723 domain-containing protein [bacterium]|nr:DUF2723 domain-containing protein [bacterium]